MLARHAVLLTPSKSSAPPQLLSCKHPAHESPQIPFFVFKRLCTLSFSVSSKSFACESYENSRVYTNNSQSGTRHSPLISRCFTQVLYFHILTHSFVRLEMPTPLFSSIPALFVQNMGGGGTFLRIRRGMRTPRCAAPSVVCESRLVGTRGLSNFVLQISVPGSALRRLCAFQRSALFPPRRSRRQRRHNERTRSSERTCAFSARVRARAQSPLPTAPFACSMKLRILATRSDCAGVSLRPFVLPRFRSATAKLSCVCCLASDISSGESCGTSTGCEPRLVSRAAAARCGRSAAAASPESMDANPAEALRR